jgi:hypothetical protein
MQHFGCKTGRKIYYFLLMINHKVYDSFLIGYQIVGG